MPLTDHTGGSKSRRLTGMTLLFVLLPALGLLALGERVPDGAEYPALLSRLMPEQLRVVNGAVPGYGIDREAKQALRLVDAVRADAAIVHFCVNDVFEILRKRDPARYARYESDRFSKAFLASAIVRAGVLWRFASLYRTPGAAGAINGLYPLEIDTPDVTAAWDEYRDSLDRLRDSLAARGVPLGVIGYPDFSQVVNGLNTVEENLRPFCEKRDVPYLDLLPVFEERREEGVPILIPDGHPDERGHRIMAKAVAEWLSSTPAPFPDLFSKN